MLDLEDSNVFLGKRFNCVSDEELNDANIIASIGFAYLKSEGGFNNTTNIKFIFDDESSQQKLPELFKYAYQ